MDLRFTTKKGSWLSAVMPGGMIPLWWRKIIKIRSSHLDAQTGRSIVHVYGHYFYILLINMCFLMCNLHTIITRKKINSIILTHHNNMESVDGCSSFSISTTLSFFILVQCSVNYQWLHTHSSQGDYTHTHLKVYWAMLIDESMRHSMSTMHILVLSCKHVACQFSKES